jgi:hypothetical protein
MAIIYVAYVHSAIYVAYVHSALLYDGFMLYEDKKVAKKYGNTFVSTSMVTLDAK